MLWLGLSRVISGIIIFVVYVRLVTYLGPAEFGKFSLVLSFYTIALILMDLGISRYFTKKVAPAKELAGVYVGNYLVIQSFVAFLLLAVFYLLPGWFKYDESVARAMFIVGLGLSLGSLSIPFRVLADVWQRLDIAALVNFMNTALTAGWMLLTILLRREFVFIFWIYLVLGVISIAVYAFLTRRWARPQLNIQWTLIRGMLIFGFPYAVIAGLEGLVQKLDVIVQKFFLSYSDVGLYSAAYRFLDFLTFIPAVVTLSVFPYLAEKVMLRDPEVNNILSRVSRYLVMLAIPIGVGGTIFAREIVATLYNEQYYGAVLPFQILIWASVLTFLYAVPNAIMLLKRTNLTAMFLAFAVVFNGVANWLLIPKWGILGSAWITVVSYILLAAAYIWMARQEASFSLFRYFSWPIIASAVMALVMLPLRNFNFFAVAGLGMLVYFSTLLIVRFLRIEDFMLLKSILYKPRNP